MPTQIPNQCPFCQSALWDNHKRKAEGKMKANGPDFSCQNKTCTFRIWPEKPKLAPTMPQNQTRGIQIPAQPQTQATGHSGTSRAVPRREVLTDTELLDTIYKDLQLVAREQSKQSETLQSILKILRSELRGEEVNGELQQITQEEKEN